MFHNVLNLLKPIKNLISFKIQWNSIILGSDDMGISGVFFPVRWADDMSMVLTRNMCRQMTGELPTIRFNPTQSISIQFNPTTLW